MNNGLGDEMMFMVNTIREVLAEKTSSKTFVGIVKDVNDPDFKGRLKVFILGVYPNEMKDDLDLLPWIPSLDGVEGFNGEVSLPSKGDFVNVIFDGDDINCPYWTEKASNISLSPLAKQGYGSKVILFNVSGNELWVDKNTGSFELKLKNGATIEISEDGDIDIDNSLCTPVSEFSSLMPSDATEQATNELLAELASKGALGANLNIKTSGKMTIQAPQFSMSNSPIHKTYVKPDILGGAFCSLPFCMFSGMPHQGSEYFDVYSKIASDLQDIKSIKNKFNKTL